MCSSDLSTLARLAAEGYVGCNLTMPLKELALTQVHEASPLAQRARSVNTITFRGGAVIGDNTDGVGCVRALSHHGVVVSGSRCVVLGAGGAARSVIEALSSANAREVVVINRTESKAHRAVEGIERSRVGDVVDVTGADVVVNCTSVGMGTNESPLASSSLVGVGAVLDAVYHPMRTKLLDTAIAAGSKAIDGLWMLVFQAVEQQRLWFGHDVDAQVMRSAAISELARRGNDPTL